VFHIAKCTVTSLAFIILLFMFVVSCNPVRRHKVLTFFFDGVPLLEGEDTADVNLPEQDKRQLSGVTLPVWIVHEPIKECTNCHDMTKKPRWATPVFTKEPLQLCYECHPGSDYSGSVDYVHGPVAIGDCMRCHNPHRSKQKHLLKLPVPDVCYQCHEKADIVSIPDHSTELLSECLECHVGHASPARGLLKKGLSADPNEDPGSRVDNELLNLSRDDI
jgi:predicted CXXCH cytochrome family protein